MNTEETLSLIYGVSVIISLIMTEELPQNVNKEGRYLCCFMPVVNTGLAICLLYIDYVHFKVIMPIVNKTIFMKLKLCYMACRGILLGSISETIDPETGKHNIQFTYKD